MIRRLSALLANLFALAPLMGCATAPQTDDLTIGSSVVQENEPPARGHIVLISASADIAERYAVGASVPANAQFCLGDYQYADFASERVVFSGIPGDCITLATFEAEAFALHLLFEERETTRLQTGASGARDVIQTHVLVEAYGEASDRYPSGLRVDGAQPIALGQTEALRFLSLTGSRTLRGPGTFILDNLPGEDRSGIAQAMLAADPQGRARTGAVRSAAPSRTPTGRPILFRVATGSQSVLSRFPRGSTVSRSTRICLERGEQVTIIASGGERVTYRGPGCARRNARPTGDNVGGFTFGWNDFGHSGEVEVLP